MHSTDFESNFNLFRETSKGGYYRRFWSDVNITPFCWTWMRGSNSKHGPRFQIDGKDYKIAKAAFFIIHGCWPKGIAFRKCFNSFCVRPSHVVDINQSQVTELLYKHGRMAHVKHELLKRCRRGHKMEGANVINWTRTSTGVNRRCRACHNAYRVARHARFGATGVTGKI